METTRENTSPARTTRLVYRHRWPLRVMHWINVLCLTILLMSGLQIFNAHPSLSLGQANNDNTAWLAMGARTDAQGVPHGVTRIFGHMIDTDGLLGTSTVNGRQTVRGFPAWATLPGPQWLSMGRRWHFFFAWLFVINGLAYVGWSLATRHLQRDLAPTGDDWRGFGRSILDHLKFRHPKGQAALRYNILQKLAYLGVVFVLGGGIVLMGLAMSPRMDAVLGWMVDLVGGRQSARSWHFLIACGFVVFVLIHVFEVIVTGVFNQLRGMITGWFRIDEDDKP
ncbi:cytochrome b/b6 domain-containing protein [Pinirhizobacter sp.]|jgi:thiosulfate reductase cytochrome b subunit|uniref:cytochrome b/b6 domain-containing protein n=1 Tax=Pinirhizobacter sp. TaxID=2950432 RepID=UPI002F42566B